MYCFSLLIQTLLVSVVLAAPKKARDTELDPHRPSAPTTASVASTKAGQPVTDYNWAGALLTADTPTYNYVTGTFTLPTPSAPNNNFPLFGATAWVGIDGQSCRSAIFQTGVDLIVVDGIPVYLGWYEWYPNNQTFYDIDFHAGDNVTFTVNATSLTSGTASVENISTGKSSSFTFVNQTNPLCMFDAEWIVEDYKADGAYVPFADFKTITFTNASAGAYTGDGGDSVIVGPGDALVENIVQGQQLTDCSVDDSSVACTYKPERSFLPF